MSDRLKYARKAHGHTQETLAKQTGCGLATIRRIEQAKGPRDMELGTIDTLAAVLRIEPAWLAYGVEPMVTLAQMTPEEQVKRQTGPGTKGLPGFVVIEGGVWETSRDGEWTVKGAKR